MLRKLLSFCLLMAFSVVTLANTTIHATIPVNSYSLQTMRDALLPKSEKPVLQKHYRISYVFPTNISNWPKDIDSNVPMKGIQLDFDLNQVSYDQKTGKFEYELKPHTEIFFQYGNIEVKPLAAEKRVADVFFKDGKTLSITGKLSKNNSESKIRTDSYYIQLDLDDKNNLIFRFSNPLPITLFVHE